jgi:hypothetical protein
MDDSMPATNLTPEQQQRAQILYEQTLAAAEGELRQMAELLASRPDGQLLGATEFRIRDLVHQAAARMIAAEIEHRQKKVTKAPAPTAPTVANRPSSKDSSDPRPM